jgi:putative ABC transport system permease protein
MFGLLRTALWRPLPYPEPSRIVIIEVDARNIPDVGATLGEVLDLKTFSHSFEQVSTIDADAAEDVGFQGITDHVDAARISDNFLPLLGVHPALGRALDARIDDGPQALSVLISDELWHRRFAGNPSVIGKAVLINNVSTQIAGVLPAGFRLLMPASVGAPQQIDLWLPYALAPVRKYRGLPLLARLRPGVTLSQANAELQTLAAQFERQYPDYYSGNNGWQASPFDRGSSVILHLTASPLHEEMSQGSRPTLLLLSGAVGFVLLIACVNVANLMLARGTARQREMEIRRALGAGRKHIMRQLLTESFLLALASSAIGLFAAYFGIKLTSHASAHLPLQSRVELNIPEALFALALSVLTTVLFGLLPAWRLASGKVRGSLHAGRTETAAASARRLQRSLVVAEVALSIVPLVGCGLMLRSFLNLQHAPLGFEPANVVTATVPFDMRTYEDSEKLWALLRDLLDRVRAIPGVESASAANPVPLAGQQTRRVSNAEHPEAEPILATQQIAIPGYLAVIGTPLLEGHDFRESDLTRSRSLTIIDRTLAKRLWPQGSAIGKHMMVYRTGARHDLEVIGVTAPVRVTNVRDEDVPHFMLPDTQFTGKISLVIKTSQAASRLAPAIQHALDVAHTGRAAFDIRSMNDYVADSVGDTRFILFVMGAFAVAAVLLAAVGLYGTLAYLTSQRTREFGIRLALGSSVQAIVAIVMRESVLLATAGVALGLIGAVACTRAIRSLLYGVPPFDTPTLLAVVALVVTVALAAGGIPAWRAATTDPQESLRTE